MTNITNALNRPTTRFAPVFLLQGTIIFVAFTTAFACVTDEGTGGEKVSNPVKKKEQNPSGKEVKDERPRGGDGSMFFKVFVSRSDQNGDGMIEKSEFRGGGDRFDKMDKNKNGKLDRDEIDELHRTRMADPLSMRQRIAQGETRRPPFKIPAKTKSDQLGPTEPTALTPIGTRITAKGAFTRLDVDKDGNVTSAEFQRSPGMGDAKKAQEIVTKIDQNGDGVLSFSEFNRIFTERHSGKTASSAAD
jgi:Ca2+-binding EF-hand superfamily protein